MTPKRRWRVPKALAWAAVTPFAAWAVARVAGLERDSLTTQLMTATPYVAAGSLVPVLLSALSRNRAAGAVALITTAALGFSVLPRALGSADAATGTPLRVVTLNMLFGHADPEVVMDLVRRLKPDVLSAQELTPGMVEKLDAAGLKEVMPHRVLEAEWSAGGSGLYARYELTPLENLFEAIGHNMPAARLNLPGAKPVELVSVHPFPPLGRQVHDWTAALDALPSAAPDRIRILAGDFNASLDHVAMRRFLDRGYTDAADVVGQGLIPTWPANKGIPPIITIDHVVVDRRVGVSEVSVHTVKGTDHRAVFADLRLPAS
ncbi:endonuclease/exonuclease/phosphatase (EEP) superfamily protein YafD [Streptosporangium becharense]|uniref:Endonuclease/exonuclease/phosphatase (EEP) superfamily protein YafD n=1 Tax=Streptosporangium becharense TaxID=1816182 RepID=A0A7W9IJM5_9ACTN|nr:endonuclease/exonuclease/phosphatase family protein [Streptosporangium becharense]MBB2913569.1 endonuclease/exonuclease/phosphatase (EEP) superfamily protein YafD [Streptosporangium becharense]MBB5821259.1 endonuclease/exonuclease/phosphatase (EEP) superfamily protein YafD [Streptosporangium becharense]